MVITVIIFILELLTLCGMNACGVEPSIWFSTILILILSTTFILNIIINKKYCQYKVQIVFGLLLRIFLLYWDIYFSDYITLPSSGVDSENYFQAGISIAHGNYSSYGGLYSQLVGIIFRIIGDDRLYVQFLNVIFSMITILIVINILTTLRISKKACNNTLWILCLLPNYAIISSIFLRESLIILIMAVSLLCFVYFYIRKNYVWYFLAIITSLLASAFHSGCSGLTVGYILVLLIFDYKRNKFSLSFVNVVTCIIVTTTLTYLLIGFSDVLFAKFAKIEDISTVATGVASGGSSYAQYVGTSDSLLNIIIYTFPRMFFFLTSPLPFQWRNIVDVMSFFLDAMFYLSSIVLAIKGIKHSKNKKFIIIMLLLLIPVTIIFGWGVSNTGTAIRHRCKLLPVFAILFACGIDNKSQEINKNKVKTSKYPIIS